MENVFLFTIIAANYMRKSDIHPPHPTPKVGLCHCLFSFSLSLIFPLDESADFADCGPSVALLAVIQARISMA